MGQAFSLSINRGPSTQLGTGWVREKYASLFQLPGAGGVPWLAEMTVTALAFPVSKANHPLSGKIPHNHLLGITTLGSFMSGQFKDIRITGLATEKTQRSQKGAAMRLMHLTLSSPPPDEWVQFFDEARRFPRHTMWRHAWIEAADIVIECVPEEIQQHHLSDLKEDVATANDKTKELFARIDSQIAKQQEAAVKERQRLEAVKDELKF